ncbi:hypothetical protein K9O30_06270 [Clostridium bowmanii]|uniref:hypothetical protein n=1 Tax=Clostridium bowmanii TaxID=132925 RepID=UPI001C0BDC8B|nr:hypothetical protein [Clostridium bowmanii]MBU3188765.1 hypothetical protein [Clostridium bowmanii]MCA1073350.1 hypothetical protein [Clostridium bowmanii]
MKYSSKKEFFAVQDKLYDAIENIFKEEIISNIDYKLIEQGLFYTPDRDIIISRKFTANIYVWLKEIQQLKGNIIDEISLCLAYDRIYSEFNSPIRGSLKFIERERFLKLSIYDLFTFREKLALLIYQIFNRQIKIFKNNYICINNKIEKVKKLKKLEKNEISFEKINIGLQNIDIYEENITWINNDEFELIKDVINQLSTSEHVKIFKEIRHPFTHRSNPGIDCLGLRSFEFKKVDDLTRKMQIHFDTEQGIKNAKELNYVIKSAIPLEKEIKFDEAIGDVLATWKLFIDGLEMLLKSVEILKAEVSKVN